VALDLAGRHAAPTQRQDLVAEALPARLSRQPLAARPVTTAAHVVAIGGLLLAAQMRRHLRPQPARWPPSSATSAIRRSRPLCRPETCSPPAGVVTPLAISSKDVKSYAYVRSRP
jgi:hypothetical protein